MKFSYKTLVFALSFLVLGSSIAFAFSNNTNQSVYKSEKADFGEELLVPGWEYGDLVARNGADYVLAVNDSHQLIGVVSATTAFIGNAVPEPTPDHAVVGYLGIVLTNVSTENGTIAAGDPIGASSEPGIGMKTTSSGYIVGRALGDFTTGTTCGAYQCGQVEVQVIPSWFDPYILAAGGTTSYMASLNGLADSDQLFATDTAGTDFAINSLAGTHTFSLPDSSSSARGLLTSTDWTTFNNKLSNIFTTKGDLLTFSTTPERLAVGADGQVLTADSTTATGLKWGAPAAGGTGTVTSVAMSTGTTGTDVNISGSPITTSGIITLNIPDASATARGLVTTGTQTFAGAKTFANNTSFANNIQQTGAKTFSTGTSTVSLNGPTSVTGTNTFAVGTGTTSLGGLLNVTGNQTNTGNLAVNGGTLSTTAATANLFNTGATTLNIGGAATTTNIATGTSANTISIGGTGANTIALGNTQTGGSILIGNSMTTGSISIGGTGAQTGTISLGVGTGSQTVNLGAGNGPKNVNIGTGTAGNTINIATTNTVADTITIGSALDTASLSSANWGISSAGIISGGTAGTALLPTYTFNGDANTGIYRSAADTIGIATNGTARVTISSTGTLQASGATFLPGLTALTGGTPRVMCVDAVTGEVFRSASPGSCSTSSAKYKHDIKALDLGLSFVTKLNPVSFTYNADGEESLGFVAEEIEKKDSRLVFYGDDKKVQGVEYERFIPILTKAIQELSARFDSFKDDIASWLGAKDNGIKRVQVEELCVGDTCIDEATLQKVLETMSESQ